ALLSSDPAQRRRGHVPRRAQGRDARRRAVRAGEAGARGLSPPRPGLTRADRDEPGDARALPRPRRPTLLVADAQHRPGPPPSAPSAAGAAGAATRAPGARTTTPRTCEPSAPTSQSGRLSRFRASSSSTPRKPSREHTPSRTGAEPSPIPAVKTSASSPPVAVAIAATAAAARYTKTSSARRAS